MTVPSSGKMPTRVEHFAIVKTNTGGFVEAIVEKPSREEVNEMMRIDGRVDVSMNLFRFDYDTILPFLERVPMNPARQENELPAAVALMVEHLPAAVRTFPAREEVPDLTSRDDIDRVNEFLGSAYPNFSWP